MVRYLVQAGDWSNKTFKTLREARRYAYRHTLSDARSYIYTGPDANDRYIGVVYKYDNFLYWKGKGGPCFLYSDGSIKYLSQKKKSKSKTNDFGLNWNLK